MLRTASISLLSGLLAAIAASACCTAPLVLVLLGFGGAWMSSLSTLEPYRPLFIAISLLALFIAYREIFRARLEQACDDATACARPRLYKWLFIGVAVMVVITIASPYLIPLFYA